ncbi:MAG: CoA transferase, partial [Chloroflexi bacterium]|nr:CoA transferase [Chloroflexota bacterium]
PTNAYRVRDGWVYIIAINENMWPKVCQVIGRPDFLTDPRFKTRRDREKNGLVVDAAVEAWLVDRTVAEAVEVLSAAGLPAAPVHDVPGAARDPHLHARDILMEVPDPVAGRIHVAGKMIKFSRTEMVVGSAPTIGQHTEEVLTGILGYGKAQVEALKGEGVV